MLATPHDVATAAVERLTEEALFASRRSGRFLLALSGGNTPLLTFRLLANDHRFPWRETEVLWADERCVPPDSPDSNYGNARLELLSRVPVPDRSIHRIRGELDPEVAVQTFRDELVALAGDPPVLDLVLLGMGADGHCASLFPGGPLAHDLDAPPVAVATRPQDGSRRVTMTLPVINAARAVLYLVTGADKAQAVSSVLRDHDRSLPSAMVSGARVTWLLDREAAGAL
ncbi:MAG: 6-phosphogluconolactonase [Candidatus Dormibacteria bacterium]